MYRLEHRQTADPRNHYATGGDFCQAFKQNLKQLYVLGFLLTASHRAAEECVVSALEKVSCNKHVFREFVPSWSRRAVINAAVHSVFDAHRKSDPIRDAWWGRSDTEAGATIDAITRLASLDRFVYVLCVLEGCSSKECSLLLRRPVEAVSNAIIHAFDQLRFHQSVRQERSDSDSNCVQAIS